MSTELWIKIISGIVTILCSVVVYAIVPWIKAKLGEQQYNLLLEVINRAVRAAEILFTGDGTGKAKKEFVLNYVSDWLMSHNINMTSEDIEIAIEGGVKAMQIEEGKINESSSKSASK